MQLLKAHMLGGLINVQTYSAGVSFGKDEPPLTAMGDAGRRRKLEFIFQHGAGQRMVSKRFFAIAPSPRAASSRTICEDSTP
jgi:hypothetical protein